MTVSDRDLLARCRRPLELLEPLALLGGQQVASLRDAMVIEHGLDALLPLAALVDERVPQAHAGSQIEQVRGWDPGLRQPPDHQQLAQMASVGAIGLGPLLSPRQPARLRGLSEMPASADRLTLFHNEPPAGRRLQRDLQPLAGEAPEELPD